ncbi:MAG: xanthine dehydrogenase family protein subunit M [Gemmatimonadota bacterium]|nr:xanthine dehydrogenase family protein subunit M [Gemmatimonadota bacterium]
MIPSPFEYERATSVANAIELLSQGGEDSRLLAGGHSLLPLMRLRLARPSLLVDIGRIDDLRYITSEGDHVVVGAMTTHHELADSRELGEACPLLAATARQIGDPQVRHRGTIGGSVAHADPASDLPAALLALDAEIVIEGADGSRSVAAADFFQGPFMSDLRDGELLSAIRVPVTRGGASYLKFQRRAQDWAIVGVAAVVESEGGAISRAAIGLTNMGGTPVRAGAVEEALVGAGDETSIAGAAARVDELDPPPGDDQATPAFRSHLASVLIRRAVASAMA